MKRRAFITLLGGAAAAWPLAARAQQRERMRLIGVLLPGTADDLQYQARVGAFLQAMQEAGWTIGRNIRIDTRWATTNAADIRRQATELAALAPDVILAYGASTVLHCCRQPAPCRSSFRVSSTRLAPASSTAWRGRAAMPPDSSCSNTA